MIALDVILLMALAEVFMFRASVLNTEGYYFFSYVFNKPYSKFVTYNVGVLAAFAYMELQNYRRL